MMEPYYSDERVTLYHGDCREVMAWLEADVLVTDPPYGRAWRQGVLRGHHTDNIDGIENDHDTAARDDVLDLWFDGSNRGPAAVFGDIMLAPPLATKHVLVYRKPSNAGLRGAIANFRRDTEVVYLLGRGLGSGIGGASSVLLTGAPKVGSGTGLGGRTGHPHEKPLDVVETILLHMPDGVVADPFAGSGSTLLAARSTNRRAIGVELEERYCEIAARRLAQGVLDFGEPA